MSERLLVTGGRDYADAERMAAYLEAIHGSRGIALLIHGGSRGADALADAWARAHGVPVQALPRRLEGAWAVGWTDPRHGDARGLPPDARARVSWRPGDGEPSHEGAQLWPCSNR